MIIGIWILFGIWCLEIGILSSIIFLYNEVLYRPLFNGLVWFYTVLPIQDLGLAIILLTVAIRLILAPLMLKASKAQKDMARIQPEIKKIQERHKGDREAQSKALMQLYAEHKVNPFSGCFILLIQLPILIALFRVFQSFDPENLQYLYSFISNPGILNPVTIGLFNLSKGNIFIGIFAAASQFFQTKLTMQTQEQQPAGDFARAFQWQMIYIFPAIILIWSITLPSALTLYWTVMNILGILQEVIVRKISKSQSLNSK